MKPPTVFRPLLDSAKRNTVLFGLAVLLSYFLLCWVAGGPIGVMTKLLVPASFLIVSPACLKQNSIIAWAAAALLLVLLGLFVPYPFGLTVILPLTIWGIANLGLGLPPISPFKVLVAILLAVLLSTTIFVSIVSRDENAVFGLLPHLRLGIASPDVLFHSSLVNLIQHGKFPSTGLHFAPYFPYQTLSHYLFAGASSLIGCPLFEFYFGAFPFFIVPFAILVATTYLQSQSRDFILALTLFIVLLLGGCVEPVETRGFLLDPSTLLGWSFLWIALLFIQIRSGWYYGILIVAACFAKIPIGLLIGAFSFLQVLFARREPKARRLILLTCICIATATGVFLFNPSGGKGAPLAFAWLALRDRDFPSHSVLHFFWDVNGIAFLFWLFYFFKSLRKHVTKNELGLVLFATALALVFNNVRAEGGNQRYLVMPVNWVCLPLLVKLFLGALQSKRIERWLAGAVLSVFTVLAVLFPTFNLKKVGRSVEAKATELFSAFKNVQPEIRATAERGQPYVDALVNLRKTPSLTEYLVEIPETETDFWQLKFPWPGERFWLPFYIPGLSGLPAYNGYNEAFMKGKPVAWYTPGTYSYHYYYGPQRDLCQSHFKGKVVISKNSAGTVVATKYPCSEAK